VVLGSTQALTELCTRNVYWGKDGRCVGLTKLPPSSANCLDILEDDVHESVHIDIIMKATNKMELYRLIYYS